MSKSTSVYSELKHATVTHPSKTGEGKVMEAFGDWVSVLWSDGSHSWEKPLELSLPYGLPKHIAMEREAWSRECEAERRGFLEALQALED